MAEDPGPIDAWPNAFLLVGFELEHDGEPDAGLAVHYVNRTPRSIDVRGSWLGEAGQLRVQISGLPRGRTVEPLEGQAGQPWATPVFISSEGVTRREMALVECVRALRELPEHERAWVLVMLGHRISLGDDPLAEERADWMPDA